MLQHLVLSCHESSFKIYEYVFQILVRVHHSCRYAISLYKPKRFLASRSPICNARGEGGSGGTERGGRGIDDVVLPPTVASLVHLLALVALAFCAWVGMMHVRWKLVFTMSSVSLQPASDTCNVVLLPSVHVLIYYILLCRFCPLNRCKEKRLPAIGSACLGVQRLSDVWVHLLSSSSSSSSVDNLRVSTP